MPPRFSHPAVKKRDLSAPRAGSKAGDPAAPARRHLEVRVQGGENGRTSEAPAEATRVTDARNHTCRAPPPSRGQSLTAITRSEPHLHHTVRAPPPSHGQSPTSITRSEPRRHHAVRAPPPSRCQSPTSITRSEPHLHHTVRAPPPSHGQSPTSITRSEPHLHHTVRAPPPSHGQSPTSITLSEPHLHHTVRAPPPSHGQSPTSITRSEPHLHHTVRAPPPSRGQRPTSITRSEPHLHRAVRGPPPSRGQRPTTITRSEAHAIVWSEPHRHRAVRGPRHHAVRGLPPSRGQSPTAITRSEAYRHRAVRAPPPSRGQSPTAITRSEAHAIVWSEPHRHHAVRGPRHRVVRAPPPSRGQRPTPSCGQSPTAITRSEAHAIVWSEPHRHRAVRAPRHRVVKAPPPSRGQRPTTRSETHAIVRSEPHHTVRAPPPSHGQSPITTARSEPHLHRAVRAPRHHAVRAPSHRQKPTPSRGQSPTSIVRSEPHAIVRSEPHHTVRNPRHRAVRAPTPPRGQSPITTARSEAHRHRVVKAPPPSCGQSPTSIMRSEPHLHRAVRAPPPSCGQSPTSIVRSEPQLHRAVRAPRHRAVRAPSHGQKPTPSCGQSPIMRSETHAIVRSEPHAITGQSPTSIVRSEPHRHHTLAVVRRDAYSFGYNYSLKGRIYDPILSPLKDDIPVTSLSSGEARSTSKDGRIESGELPGSKHGELLPAGSGVRSQQAFRTQPRNVTVKAGGTAVLRCEVLRPSGVVQWVKDGLLLGPQRSLPGFPRYSMTGAEKKGQYHLRIEKVALEDDSSYECQVGQSESSGALISQVAIITVLIPPSRPVFEAETDEPWVAGKEYTVTCTAPDAKPAAEVTLFRDGVELTNAYSVTMSGSEEKLENTEASVSFTPLSSDHGQELLCRAINPALPHALDARLLMNVYFPSQAPVIEGLQSEEVKAGTLLKLVCSSQGGNPLATLHWTKNEEVLSSSWEEDRVLRRSSSVLTLLVRPEDNHAVLCCESVNQVSLRPLSVHRTLRVLFEPSKLQVRGSSEAVEGKEVTLSCSASSSNPPVQIRWWLGFRELNTTVETVTEGKDGGMETMSNLTHRVSQQENGLPLICEAFNRGTRFSKTHSSTLKVFYPPQKVWMDAPPEGTVLRAGATVRLVCYSTGGNPPGQLTWYKGKSVCDNRRTLPSEKGVSRELVLILQPSDNMAVYRCNATNQARKVLSTQTKLHVQFPAVGVTIAANRKETRSGDLLNLTCVSGSSNPRTNITWTLGAERVTGVDQAPRKAEFGGVSVRSVLTLSLSSNHNGHRVTCHAFSSLLSEGVNSFYTLNVLFPPEFGPDQPKLIHTAEDDIALLPLTVSANPDEISCEWTYQGETLAIDGYPRYHRSGGVELEIWNVTRRDAGRYTAVCSNSEGETRTAVALDVQYPPSVRAARDPVYVDLGLTADLECVADANPIVSGMFSWEWLGEDDPLPGSEREDEATGWLTIPEVARSHSGRYRCTVDNGIAPPASAEVRLVVRFQPEVQKGAQWSKVASRGDGSGTAQVACQAEGVPRVDFLWAKNGVPVDFSDPRYRERTVREGAVHTSTVTVVNVSAALDYAVFTCTARNGLGEDRLLIQLLSTNHPDPPSDLQLVSVSHSMVTLQWTAGFDGGLEQRFRVRYRWAGSASALYVDVFPPRDTTFTVGGLSPHTTYTFSVNAINAMGDSEYADNNAVLTVTTREMDPQEEESPRDDGDAAESFSVATLAVTLSVVGGVLLVLNALGCFWGLRRRKGRSLTEASSSSLEEKKSDVESRSTVTGLNRYEGGELINTAARRTLLVDSGSETESNAVYETYGGDSAHYYYPTGDFRPTLYPHPEGPEEPDGGYRTGPGAHIYEEVMDWGTYEDLGGLPLPPASAMRYPGYTEPHATWECQETAQQFPQGAYQRRARPATDLEPPIRVHDTVTELRLPRRDSELPFELRGELV
ncbi:nephrin [Conger conger]|uniref:nephrin n=1 Tax=Conger conger TaxID=82655 RepID=UPI002A5AC9AA|nr:nephrin [Conger conger]